MGMDEWRSQCKPQLVAVVNWEIASGVYSLSVMLVYFQSHFFQCSLIPSLTSTTYSYFISQVVYVVIGSFPCNSGLC